MAYESTDKTNRLLAQLELAKRQERGYIVSERATVTANGGTFNLNLDNPSGSGVNLIVTNVVVTTQFQGVYDAFDTFSTAPSGGSSITIDNLLMDTGNIDGATQANAATDVTFTGNSPHISRVIPSGGGGGQIGGETDAEAPIIQPEREIVVEVTNRSGTDADASITVVYIEVEN